MSSSRALEEPAAKYFLEFNLKARKEFDSLAAPIRLQLAKKLKTRLSHPRVEADKLAGMPNCYKIKLRSIGYRLVYQIVEERLVVLVIAVGKREKIRSTGPQQYVSATDCAKATAAGRKNAVGSGFSGLTAPAAASPAPCSARPASCCPPARRSGLSAACRTTPAHHRCTGPFVARG